MTETLFQDFPKIARFSREIIITEKIDGTNGHIYIGEDGEFLIGSRNRWLTLENDNFGFCAWAHAHRDECMLLGRHYGEWWGRGIQRGYGLQERRFSLFNVVRWSTQVIPGCLDIVPIIYRGPFYSSEVDASLNTLRVHGSSAVPGYMKPEGVIIFHVAGNVVFKKTILKDEVPKGLRCVA